MKLVKTLAIGAVFAAVATNANAAGLDVCNIVSQLSGVFKTLRTLAFVGAAFFLLQFAWTTLTAKEIKMDDIMNKGLALLVGTLILFSVGVLINMLVNGQLGCDFTQF